MSQENNDGSPVEDQDADVQSTDYVSKKAYEEVSKDMHKYKSTLKNAQAKAAEYEAQLKSMQEAQMRENEQWKELSEKYKAEAEIERNSRLQDRQSYVDTVKRSALKDELGGKINDAYLVHANINGIEVNEHGVVDRDSLLSVANDFRKDHGSLIQSTKGVDATSMASPLNSTVSPHIKSHSDMSTDELALELIRIKNIQGA